jgi:hypothetical protein
MTQPYAGRSPASTVLQLDVENEAAQLLRFYGGHGRRLGRLVSRLVYEHHARQEERQRMQQEQALAGAGAGERQT